MANGTGGDDVASIIANAQRAVSHIIPRLRAASFDIVDAIQDWRKALGYESVYLWRGVSYLSKMRFDLAFVVASSPLSKCFAVGGRPYAIVDNPLLNPAVIVGATLLSSATAGGATSATHVGGAPTQIGFGALVTSNVGGPPSGADDKTAITPPASTPSDPTAEKRARFREAELTILRDEALFSDFQKNATRWSFDPRDHQAGGFIVSSSTVQPDPAIIEGIRRECLFRSADDAMTDDVRQRQADAELRRRVVLHAVVTMQRVVRGHLARIVAVHERRRVRAATKLQAHFRRLLATLNCQRRRQRYQAAVRIQARQRGIAVRRRMVFFRALHHHAVTIQRVVRGFLARRRYHLQRGLHGAAVAIQRHQRGVSTRREVVEKVLARRCEGAVQIQRHWKGMSVRQTTAVNRAMGVLQRVGRGVNVRRTLAKIAALQQFLRGTSQVKMP